ncbi:hypothetical protein SVI_2274 [Shewanella violacea DSS12]|uniref:OmpR/PhoB-type domain-containing protein n=1 Tax=Shewanella violacea (strain JCM 10179 / CIP 106290 / LMG 19151 / DSS12) TaxID=637905 RepID=D4ZKP6_SHEVD|nr:hypothetical protein SVI_2274 [Shewanella violacea DSS12]
MPIRANEANLLALLLSDPGTIFSKETILDIVWSDKIVSEQAVFQNISNLRGIFGESAIKTFSRKGYQWQFALEDAPLTGLSKLKSPQDLLIKSTQKPPIKIRNIVLVSLTTILFLFIFLINTHKEPNSHSPAQQKLTIMILPFCMEDKTQEYLIACRRISKAVKQKLARSTSLRPVSSASTVSFMDFTNTPNDYFKSLTMSSHGDLVLAGKVRMHKGIYMLRYALKGERNAWHGEFQSHHIGELATQVTSHIEKVATTPLLMTRQNSEYQESAQLQVLHHKYPNDLIIFERLITRLFNNGDLDKAVLLADELKASALADNNLLYHAKADLLLGNILIEQGLTSNGEAHLQTALRFFQQQEDYRSQSDTFKALALAERNRLDYLGIKSKLQQAASLARLANDPLREIAAMSYLFIFAHKLDQNEDKAEFLNQAELLLDQYRLPAEHYAEIYLHRAMISDSPLDIEQYTRRILALFTSEREDWVITSAQMILTDLLIKQSRWQEAHALFSTQASLQVNENYLVATIYYVQQDFEKAASYGMKSFKNANLNGDKGAALDAALLLFQINKALEKPDEQIRFKHFINKDSTLWWTQHNLDKLALAGLSNKHKAAGD